MTEEKLITILFGVLLIFILLNVAITLALNFSYKKGVWRQLSYYWLSVLGVFFLQALPRTESQILFFITASYLPLTILGRIPFQTLNKRFPLSWCLAGFAASYPAIYFLHKSGLGFTVAALPMSTMCTVPMLLGIGILFKNWKSISLAQKFLLLPLIGFSIHNYNFALFRMEPNAQLWGWAVTFSIYQTLGILLPAIAIEESRRSESERLSKQVQDRTFELQTAISNLRSEISLNKDLIKVVLHDISNPLTSLLGRLYLMESQNGVTQAGQKHLDNALTAGNSLRSIIEDVRKRMGNKLMRKSVPQTSEDLEASLLDLQKVYSSLLEEKNIRLNVTNTAKLDAEFMMEEGNALINTVFSNMVSNAIKFSYPNTQVDILLKEEPGFLLVDIRDYGKGISPDVVKALGSGQNPESSDGTFGEKGTGMGLLLAKNFIERNYGHLLINPDNPDKGTQIRIKIKKEGAIALEEMVHTRTEMPTPSLTSTH